MIKTRLDLKEYLYEDRIQLNKMRKTPRLLGDEVWVFQILLRKEEFHLNNNNKIRSLFYKIRRHSLGVKLGFTIPPNVFGPGLSIAHYGTIIVNKSSRIGKNCRIHASVNIGTSAGKSGLSLQAGDNLYVGPGAKIFGPVVLGDNVAIGANAVVNKSYEKGGVTLGGVPAKIIADRGSQELWLKDYEVELLREIK